MSRFCGTLFAIAVLAVLAAATCSSGPSSRRQQGGQSGTASGGAGGAAGAAAADCARFKFTFSQLTSCGTCPADTSKLCPCLTTGFVAAILADRRLTCAFGRCLSGMDCPATCAYLGDPNTDPIKGGEALEVLARCLDAALTVSCDRDAVCNDGRCVGEDDSGGGICRTGGSGIACRNAGDCLSGACVTTDIDANARSCGDARPEAVCNDDGHCGGGRCIKANANAGLGICTNGASNEPCFTKADCSGYACVPISGSRFDVCSDGNPDTGDRCAEPAHCRSNFCVQGECSSGEETSRCTAPRECKSGFCELGFAGADPGYCVSGDNGTRCGYDTSCKSGLCGLNVGDSLPGRCTAGTRGEPCAANDDCTSKSCATSQPPVVVNSCDGDLAGLPCGNGGVCASDGACYYGRCS